MGTEVLRPQDCLVRHSPVFRKPNPNCSPSSNPNPSARSWRRAATYGGRQEARRRWEGSPKRGGAGRPQQVVVGRVGILKRGDDAAKKAEGWEAAVFGAGRLRPDPDAIPKGLRLRGGAAKEAEGADAYAGSAFAASPSPRALPLPRFPRRSEASEEATRALRRLLRLE